MQLIVAETPMRGVRAGGRFSFWAWRCTDRSYSVAPQPERPEFRALSERAVTVDRCALAGLATDCNTPRGRCVCYAASTLFCSRIACHSSSVINTSRA